MSQTVKTSAELNVMRFLREYSKHLVLKIKIIQYNNRITNIQTRARACIDNSRIRQAIVEELLHKEFSKMQMKLVRTKNKKLEKQLRGVTEEILKQVALRYIRFCHDHHAFVFQAWRKRVKSLDLNKKQLKTYNMLLALRKKNNIQLRDQNGKIQKDPALLGP